MKHRCTDRSPGRPARAASGDRAARASTAWKSSGAGCLSPSHCASFPSCSVLPSKSSTVPLAALAKRVTSGNTKLVWKAVHVQVDWLLTM